MKEELNTLKLAAWALILIGTLETIFLVYAIRTGTNFSGGAFLYIIAGIFLLKKNRTVYKFSLFTFTTLFALIPAAIIFLTLVVAQLYTATDIPISWRIPVEDSLVAFVYLGLIVVLAALLYHPNTREALSLEKYRGRVWTMYMSQSRFFAVMAASVAIAGLLVGPHILHNPYKLIVAGLQADGEIRNRVGELEQLELLYSAENNWHVVSDWKITGKKGQGTYRTVLNPNSSLTIRVQ
jgi:hypothetical protein